MNLRLRLIFVLMPFFSLAFTGKLSAQLCQQGIPRSFSLAMASDTTGVVIIAPPSTGVVLREDEQKPIPYRFALNLPVDLGIGSSGHWSKASDGTNVWRLSVKSPGALALSLYFDHFVMHEGGKLFVYNPQRTQVIGAFTSLNNNNLSTFATALIRGDQLTIEYNAPDGVPAPEMHIAEVAYAYRGISEYSRQNSGFNGSGPCEVNINCTEGENWQKQKRSVTRIQVKRGGQNLWCTGSLVNNTLNDGKPYVITADHCGNLSSAADISQWIFYFNYEGQDCPDPTKEPVFRSITGASLIAHGGNGGDNGSDFFLVLLKSAIPDSFNVYFNGWSRETSPLSPSGVGIHHPQGDVKKISTYTKRLTQASWAGGAVISHWQVQWSGTPNGHGTTEGGSSGSPLFDSEGRLVGTLTGGQSSCDSIDLESPDYYGQFAYDWDKNGNDSINVLKYWLDPTNLGVMTLNGWSMSVVEPIQSDWITIYPNPATDLLYLRTNGSAGKHLQVMVSDLWGKMVLKSSLSPVQGSEFQVNLNAFSAGMYLVTISDGERQVVRKIIKQ